MTMDYLKTNFKKMTYYIKNNVVFDITTIPSDDSCALNITEENKSKLPSIVVSKQKSDGSTVDVTYYLDVLICDGDKFSSNKFSKLMHSTESSEETYITYLKYYGILWKNAFKRIIANHPSYDKDQIYELAIKSIPLYMIKGENDSIIRSSEGETINDVLIDMESFDAYKGEVAYEKGLKAANDAVRKFGYEVEELSILSLP